MLTDKVIWITGASSGIGKALAIECSREQARVILSGRNINELEKVKDFCLQFTPSVKTLPFDLIDIEKFEDIKNKAFSFFGIVDILINNGGISQRSIASETSLDIDRKIMEVNYFGNIALTKALLPQMIILRSGHLVVISSLSGKFGWQQRSAYSASKFALQGFYESLRAEIKKYNIQVTIVYPGRIKTNISLHAITKDGSEYNKMDSGQEKGISAEECAKKIIGAIYSNRKEIIIARKERLVYFFRKFMPALYYSISTDIDPNK